MVTKPPPVPPQELVPLETVRIGLARLWMIGAGALFLILVIQSLNQVYKDLTQDVWGWFLPTILPTMTMIFTVLTYTALNPQMSGFVVRRSFASVAKWLSLFYLFVVSLTILLRPYSAHSPAEAIGLMRTSNLWLGPLQGIVASSMGVLFVSKQKLE